MILPGSFTFALILAILGTLLWGSWANTFKARPGKWRYELYCFDFAIGVVIVAVLIGLTLGQLGYDGFSVTDDVSLAGKKQDLFAFIAGGLFGLGNMLLIGAISLSGMAVAFPIGMGVAVFTGVILQSVLGGGGNAVLLYAGGVVVLGAVVVAALAFKAYSMAQWLELVREGKTKTTKKTSSNKAIILGAVGGVFIGGYSPMMSLARSGENGLGPYSAVLVAALGLAGATVVFNLFLMNLPIQGDPVDIAQYLRAKSRTHALGVFGGMLWGAGSVALAVAARAEGAAVLNPAILYAATQAGVIVATLWGIYRWHEFTGADTKVRFLGNVTVILLVIGVALASSSQLVAGK